MITYYSIREDQNVSGGDRHLDHHTLRLADYHYATTIPSVVPTLLTHKQLFWMAIVEQLSLGRVCQEEGERNGDASWSRRGTDPALLYRFRMTYTTRPP
uniref:Tyrosine-protein phosphatase domain-containing protein n=1 Tax=Heterorhabditis bacteriophora TaxID=37862 RepID=A0A1I7WBU4_HETBA